MLVFQQQICTYCALLTTFPLVWKQVSEDKAQAGIIIYLVCGKKWR